MRHTLAWAEGDTTEDHLGAILWNAAAMDWTESQIVAGKLPAELDDQPYRSNPDLNPFCGGPKDTTSVLLSAAGVTTLGLN